MQESGMYKSKVCWKFLIMLMREQMSKIMITGASSFIGVNLIQELIKKNYDIIALVRRNSHKKQLIPSCECIRVIELDMEDYKNASKVVGDEVDCLVHLSWNGTRAASRDDAELQKNNYKYSMDIVHGAISMGCKRIISAGSQAEYGICDGIISEESKCNPITEYGKQKLNFYADTLALCQEKGISFKEPRFFSLYGCDDYEESMMISIIKKMLSNEKCDLTLGIQMWDFLHVSDATRGLVLLIEKQCEDGVYNFGSGDTRMLKDFLEEMRMLAKSDSILNYGVIPYPQTGMTTIQPDVRKLVKQTGWYPQISFQEGVLQIMKKYKLE